MTAEPRRIGRPPAAPPARIDAIMREDRLEATADELRTGIAEILDHCARLSELFGRYQAEVDRVLTAGRLLTTGEVAKLLRVNDDTVRAMARTGKLASLTVGDRSPRFRESDVLACLERRA